MRDVIAADETSVPLEVLEASGGGMDWSSFWPDMLVAGLTTGAIAALVLLTEQRISRRSARRSVFEAQTRAVHKASLLLEREFTYGYRELAPDTKNLAKLRKVIEKVPAGDPTEPVRGYYYAERTAATDESLRIRIESLNAHIERYARKASYSRTFVESAFLDHAISAALNPDSPRVWNWDGMSHVFPSPLQQEVESDGELSEDINGYAIQRRLLNGYRKAFFIAYSGWRVHEWAASIEAVKGDPRWPKTWWREWKRRSFVAAAKRKADAEAAELVTGIDPYEGYP